MLFMACGFLSAWTCSSLSYADEPTLTAVAVYPSDVHLTTARDRQTLVVQATYSNGITHDITQQSSYAIAHPEKAKIDGVTISPVADGDTTLTVTFADRTIAVPVHVEPLPGRSGPEFSS